MNFKQSPFPVLRESLILEQSVAFRNHSWKALLIRTTKREEDTPL